MNASALVSDDPEDGSNDIIIPDYAPQVAPLGAAGLNTQANLLEAPEGGIGVKVATFQGFLPQPLSIEIWKLWGFYMIHTLFMHFVFQPWVSGIMSEPPPPCVWDSGSCGGGGTCADDGTHTQTCTGVGAHGPDHSVGMMTQLSDILSPILSIGPFIHCIMIPVFMKKKCEFDELQTRNSMTATQSEMRADGPCVVFAIKYTLLEKIFIFTLGTIIWAANIAIKILKFIGLDLSSFWFPMPFFEFWQANLQVSNYRIMGAELRLNASPADAYFRFLKGGLFNFYTLGFYSRCYAKVKGLNYERWLDSKVEWVGAPPNGCTNQFQIFHDKMTCPQKLTLFIFNVMFGWLPFVQVIGSVYSYKKRLDNLTFGGIQPVFKPEYGLGSHLAKYISTACWAFNFCGAWERKYVDTMIAPLEINPNAAAEAQQEMMQQSF